MSEWINLMQLDMSLNNEISSRCLKVIELNTCFHIDCYFLFVFILVFERPERAQSEFCWDPLCAAQSIPIFAVFMFEQFHSDS